MKICREFDLRDYNDFGEFLDDLTYDEDIYLASEVGEAEDLPCYLDLLKGTQHVRISEIPAILEAACFFHLAHDGLLLFSVVSNEANYRDWLDAVRDYPGATITEHIRDSGKENQRTCYLVAVPVIPQL